MQTASHRSPTSLPVSTGTSLGRRSHFSAVAPFVRANLALRRLALAAADTRVNRKSEQVTKALLEEIRRAADARSLA